MANEVVIKQEEQVEELAAQNGMSKEEFLKKAQETSKPAPKAKPAKKAPKAKPAPKATKAKPAPKVETSKSKKRIVGVKDLEKEFKLPGKTIRRYLRKMNENTKPRGPEPYQWFEDDKSYKAIRENLKAIVTRKPALQ